MKTTYWLGGLAVGALLGFTLHTGAQNPPASPAKPATNSKVTTSKTQTKLAPIAGSARALTVQTRNFLATLDEKQRERAVFDFASDERWNWNYVPMTRRGILWRDLNAAQRKAALQVLRVALSVEGLQKIERIRALEPVLFALENSNPTRDENLYTFAVFGTPDTQKAWSLRYEGHHVSLHWTVWKNRVVADSPQFLGANPARVPDEARFGAQRGTRALAQEEDLGRAFVQSLDSVQRQSAILSDNAPPEIITTNKRRAAIAKNEGVAWSQLNAAQQTKLVELIEEHARVLARDVAKARLLRLKKAGVENIKFAWMGSVKAGEAHYYRVQGPTFLIEYDNTQNNANHIHTVWRDFGNDFGEDVLREHLTDPHSHHAH